MREPARVQPIAIVGLAGRFPGARDLDQFWRNVRDGVETLETLSDADLDAARVPAELRADPRYVRRATPLDGADQFDASFFGFSPREAQVLDPQQRTFLECAWEALEHAGYAGAAAGQAVGVFGGVGMNSYLLTQLLANPRFLATVGGYQLMVGSDKDFLASRVSYKLDLRGPAITVQTACSTSLVAVVLACRALQRGECDLALAGGVSILFPQRAGYLYEEGMIFSPDGQCRPFDEAARGTRGSSGAAIVVLKRLVDAIADRDAIHAVVLGAAINNDGAAKAGYTAPSVEGQVEAIATAQALAGVDPRTIGYVETHGTGTPLGDPIEIAALTQVFRGSTADTGFCRLGSLKANLGHLDAAAGAASLVKAALVLENRTLPPLVNFRKANPQLALDTSPFVASASAAPWDSPAGGTPRRAGVSSFGIGGTNAHVILEEAPPVTPSAEAARGAHLLVLSAKTTPALDRATANLAAHLRDHPDVSLADVEWTLQAGRQAFAHRRAVVVRDRAGVATALENPQRPPVLTGTSEGAARPVAFLFSGQGSQHVGMGAGLYRTERVYRDTFDRCAALLEPHLGLDLRSVVFGADGDGRIDQTRLTQPALFATELALASLWMSWGVQPVAMVGHSIGEYVAAHLAGVLSLEDALAVVAARGRLMQALPAGSMAAVHLGATELERLLGAGSGVEIAALNAPGLCTLSGPTDAIAVLARRLEASGVDVRPLHTSHAFHSAMMEPALGAFTDLLRGVALSAPAIPYASNLTGTWITEQEATSPSYYAQHLRRAVRFEECLRTVTTDPAVLCLEVGPGNALTSLARLTLGKDGAKRAIASLAHPRERRPDHEAALEAAGRLWIAGVAVDWKGLHAGETPRRVPLPTYAFERKRHWVDAEPATPGDGRTTPSWRTEEVGEWLYEPTWTRDAGPARAPHLDGTWLVLAQPGSLGEALARQVESAGGAAVTVEAGRVLERLAPARFRVRPGSPEDLKSVVRDVRATGARIAGAFHLWSIAPARPERGAAEPKDERQPTPVDLSYHALVTVADALQGTGDGPVRLLAATIRADSVLDEPVRRTSDALALGPILVLPTEIPGLWTRAVDLDTCDGPEGVERAAAHLVEEAASGDGETVVARRGGRRWVRRCERIRAPAIERAALPLRDRGVVLITGGLGGVGLTLARWLAENASARLLLTSRTPLPPRDAWDEWLASRSRDDRASGILRAILEIEKAGGEVLVAAADVADEGAMRRAIDAARARWGRIDGVIHGAGVAGNERVALLKDDADVRAVLAPKVDGLSTLVRLLGSDALDFVVLLSTFNTLVPVPGVCDYVAANAVLDAFVDSADRPRGWARVMTVNYAPWQDVGMAARILGGRQEGRQDFLQAAISPAGGADAFGRALASGRNRVVVVPFDLARALALLRDRRSGRSVTGEAAPAAGAAEPATPEAEAAHERPEVSTAYAPPETDAERRLAAIWSELLGVDRIGVHDDFFALGGHSLMATRVLARVGQSLGAQLSLRDIFEAPTIHLLAAKLNGAVPHAVQTSAVAPAGEREELEF